MSTMKMLRKHPRVAIVDDEREMGNAIIVTMKKGFTFDPMCDNRVGGADTVSEAIEMVNGALKYEGPYDP
jgi:hypothetical protein